MDDLLALLGVEDPDKPDKQDQDERKQLAALLSKLIVGEEA